MKKRFAMIAAAAALTGALLIGGTLAYLTAAPKEKVNTFTVGAELTGELKEPLFDGVDFEKPEHHVEVPAEEKWGKSLASNFVPGRVIPKDPAVANTSASTDAWVAVKLDYTTGVIEEGVAPDPLKVTDIEAFATIDWDTTNWTLNDEKTVAYYNEKLPAGKKTPTVFNTVIIDNDATSKTMKSFEITITAYLVQAEGFKSAEEAMAATFDKPAQQ